MTKHQDLKNEVKMQVSDLRRWGSMVRMLPQWLRSLVVVHGGRTADTDCHGGRTEDARRA